MCILFIYTNPSPQPGGYRLIVASNRDEYYKRPARQAFHCEETGIIGGRDMEPGREGGMWLGATVKRQHGKIAFAALLNVTGAAKVEGAQGRGPIVRDYITTPAADSLLYFEDLKTKTFAGFNVVTVEVTKNSADVHHYSNCCPDSETLTYPGKQILGFGNSNPTCPLIKVKNGRNKFEEIVEIADKLTEEELVGKLLGVLKCEDRHLPDEELEKRAPAAFEFLSQVYVKIPGSYGTRTHSVILVDHDGNLVFTEHTMKEPILDVDRPQWEVNVIRSRL